MSGTSLIKFELKFAFLFVAIAKVAIYSGAYPDADWPRLAKRNLLHTTVLATLLVGIQFTLMLLGFEFCLCGLF